MSQSCLLLNVNNCLFIADAQVQLITDSGQPSENVVYTAYPSNIGEFQL